MSQHAKRIVQPSQFKRTLGCPGWGNASENIPDKPSSKYAMEGSIAHYLGECCLRRDEDAEKYLGLWGWDDGRGKNGIHESKPAGQKHLSLVTQIDGDMVENVQVYLDEIRRKKAKLVGAKFSVEERFDMSWLIPGMFGTGDHIASEPLGLVCVDDLKYGKGVAVEIGEKVGDNPQTCLYGLGAIGAGNPRMFEEIQLTVIQPRAPHPDGRIRSVTFDVEDLLEWGMDVARPAAAAARKPDAPLNAGDWCKWCPAESTCPELRRKNLEATKVLFDSNMVPELHSPTPPLPANLTGEQLDRILAVLPRVKSWIAAVHDEAFERLNQGRPDAPQTMKIVEGTSKRRWRNEEEADATLRHVVPDAYEPVKLLSPAKMEKELTALKMKPKDRRALLDPLIDKPPGKRSMVPLSDKKPALPPVAEEAFKNIEI